ncbi:MAG: P-type ATPase [Bdellovibrionota bacterium]
MKLRLDETAVALALSAAIFSLLSPSSPYAFWLLLASLPFSAWQLFQFPHRALYVVGFFTLGLLVVLLEWPFPQNIGNSWIPMIVFSLQLRLALLGIAERRAATNREFAEELSSVIPENSLLFIDNDIETTTPTASLNTDHTVRMQPEETLPTDGIVSFGSGFADELLLTGDPEPAAKGVGRFVFAGSKNRNTTFLYRVMNTGKNTFLMRKAEFLRRGFYEMPLKSSRFLLLDLFTLVALVAIHIAVENSSSLLLGVWLCSLGSIFAGANWALGLAMTARSAAAGVIWPGLLDLTMVGKANSMVTDPEGSVMEGSLRLSGVATDEAMAEEGALRLAGPLARRIESPAAYAILKELRLRNIPLELLDSFQSTNGGGVGVVAGEEIRFCDESTAMREQIPHAKFSSFLTQEMNRPGASACFLIKNGKVIAAYSFVDSIRSSTAPAVKALANAGIPLILVSAARKESVQALAKEIGAEHFHGEAGPSTAENLLMSLNREGLEPIWLDNGLTPIPSGSFAKILTPLARAPRGVIAARWDLDSAWQTIRLARNYLSCARVQFLLALL